MLRLYRRHTKDCPHTSYNYRRCGCPIWVRGTLNHTKVRMSLDQTNWDAATKIVGAWTDAGDIGEIIQNDARTVTDAIDNFMLDCSARKLARDTIKKYNNLLGGLDKAGHPKGRLLKFCKVHKVTLLSACTSEFVMKFRATWRDAPITTAKTQERLTWFFAWCVRHKWLKENPADALSAVKVPDNPTLPFTPDEMKRILEACDRYPTANKFGYDNRARVKAFVLLSRWTGLRMADVATIEWTRLQDGKVFLYTQKTGQAVYVPTPPEVSEALEKLEKRDRYVFWTGVGDVESTTKSWRRTLWGLFRLAEVHGGHAHRFRDTFAVELLLKGVDIADVSILLGHRSQKTTEKHYAPWVHARQTRLESAVQRTWLGAAPPAPSRRRRRAPRSTQESAIRRVI